MALFITFEGGEGSGKSTQSRRLYRQLTRLAIPVLLTHEPGVTRLGKKITRLLKWTDAVAISPLAELLLFNVSRAQLVEEIIRPGLEKGVTVICDRFADSTTAYQGYGRGLDMTMVSAVNKIGTSGLVPDLTVLLDMPVEKGLARKAAKKDRFEAESEEFHRRVRGGYLKIAQAEPERWLVIDAMQSKEKIAGAIWQRVSKLLSK
ncbi:MAG TPA: dTMP kinase [Dehalococcoidales bacterium]|nr:dTMP kinase [Dehalococcoidales bacterium]